MKRDRLIIDGRRYERRCVLNRDGEKFIFRLHLISLTIVAIFYLAINYGA